MNSYSNKSDMRLNDETIDGSQSCCNCLNRSDMCLNKNVPYSSVGEIRLNDENIYGSDTFLRCSNNI